jgi:DNA primase
VGSDSEHWEHEIIRLLISFGDKPVTIEVIDEEKKPKEYVALAAVYIISSIAEDQLRFENKVYQAIFDEYVGMMNEEKVPTHQDFINHINPEINSLTISILTNKYDISENWLKHSITVTKEEDLIKMAVVNSVSAFKSSKVDKILYELKESLKTQEYEDQLITVAEISRYEMVKKQLAAQLGRIILR